MRPLALASLAVVLALAGCGGTTPTQKDAAIPRSVADRLAAQSESIAAAWEAGDTCGAAQQADELKHAADDAIKAGDIPAAYQDDLSAAVLNLQNTANCTEEPEHETKPKEQPTPPKPKGHDKPDKPDKHDDGVTIPTDTTTEDEG